MKKTTYLVTLILLVTPLNILAEQILSTWTGGGDGASWNDPYNWNPAIIPDNDVNTFAVTVDDSGNIYLKQNRTVDQLICYNTVLNFRTFCE